MSSNSASQKLNPHNSVEPPVLQQERLPAPWPNSLFFHSIPTELYPIWGPGVCAVPACGKIKTKSSYSFPYYFEDPHRGSEPAGNKGSTKVICTKHYDKLRQATETARRALETLGIVLPEKLVWDDFKWLVGSIFPVSKQLKVPFSSYMTGGLQVVCGKATKLRVQTSVAYLGLFNFVPLVHL
ncbi:hypothetical protein T439DRAFT_348195 [Meredithblackwellia eburnea MCA 4105]